MHFKFIFLFLILQTTFAMDLRVCYESSPYYPYLNEDQSGRAPGILVEIIEEATKHIDINLVLYRSSWKRCLTDLKRGLADGIFAAIWSSEREEWASFPKDKNGKLDVNRFLWKVNYKVHVRKDSKITWNGKQFSKSDIKVSAPRNYIAFDLLEKLNVVPRIYYKASQGLRLVAKKRLDGFVIEEKIGKNLLRKHGLTKDVVPLKNNFFEAIWYLPLSKKFYKKHSEIAEKLFTAINDSRVNLKEDLVKKYDNLD